MVPVWFEQGVGVEAERTGSASWGPKDATKMGHDTTRAASCEA